MLPKDPMVLLSFVNTRLRDEGVALDELCAALDVERSELEARLAEAGFCYDAEKNRFR